MDGGYSLVHNDTNGIIEQALSKDNGVKLWVDFVLVEDGEDRDRVRG